jgi:hypothetical protein
MAKAVSASQQEGSRQQPEHAGDGAGPRTAPKTEAVAARASMWRRMLDLFRRKRHRKEIDYFPPAKVYASGRHEVKTSHHQVKTESRHGRLRGGREK